MVARKDEIYVGYWVWGVWQEYMTTMRENAAGLVGVIVALILVGISLILYTTGAFSGKEKRQPTFLVAGPSYSGKTSLFRKVSGDYYIAPCLGLELTGSSGRGAEAGPR